MSKKVGKPFSRGATYFNVASDIARNGKIKELRLDFGNDGFTFLVFLWAAAYEKDYFMKWTKRDIRHFCNDHGFAQSLGEELTEFFLKEDLFDRELYEKYEILTSVRMQDFWMKCTVRNRQTVLIKEYLLIEVDTSLAKSERFVIVDLNGNVQKLKKTGTQPGKGKKGSSDGELQFNEPPKEPVDAQPKIVPYVDEFPESITEQQLKAYIATPYQQRSEKFQMEISEAYYKSYIDFSSQILFGNRKMLDKVDSHVTINQYRKFAPEHNFGKEDLEWVITKLNTYTKKDTFDMYFKIIDFIKNYYWKDKQRNTERSASHDEEREDPYQTGAAFSYDVTNTDRNNALRQHRRNRN